MSHNPADKIFDTSVCDELRQSFLEYSMSVIVSRALPDVRDGLKPVHRRIVFGMFGEGLRSDRPHKKSVAPVAEVMKKFHPHGDKAIYDSLVRMAQSWALRLPLVDGHGNFGSLDDGPAAMRYCLTGDARVRLADGTSVRLDSLAALAGPGEAEIDVKLLGRTGEPVVASRLFCSGLQPTLRLVTREGFGLEGSTNHPVLVLAPVAGVPVLVWKLLSELAPGDRVAIPRINATELGGDDRQTGAGLDAVGAASSNGWRVPEALWSSGPGTKRSFLRALFSRYASVAASRNGVEISYPAPGGEAAGDVQLLVAEFGVIARVAGDDEDEDGTLVIISGAEAALFCARIGLAGDTAATAQRLFALAPQSASRRAGDSVPHLAGYLRSAGRPGQAKWLAGHDLASYTAWCDGGDDIAARVSPEAAKVALQLVEQGHYYATVSRIEDAGVQAVYSPRIEADDHAYVANGFINHNTEARMATAAEALVQEVDEDTVDFVDNFDGTEREPTVLPALFPNLLVNGSAGIAVGMATNMAPHNLIEVVAGLQAMLENPEISLEEMMVHIPGPDLPTGGVIVGLDGVRDAYATGRGSFRTRAVATIGEVSARRKGITITELPYMVGPERVISKIKEALGEKRLQGVADVKDLSGRKVGLRLVIECKTGFNPAAVLEELYRLTPLEDSFGINNVALVGGQPRTLGLLELCRLYLEHRLEVVRRRTAHRLAKAEARAHILDGLILALASIDEVVAILRASKDAEGARLKLAKAFKLSDIQVTHILDMPLRRLTSLEVSKLRDELRLLRASIAELTKLLASPALMRAMVSTELGQAADAFGDPRRTKLLAAAPPAALPPSLQVPDTACLLTLTTSATLGRTEAVDGDVPAFRSKPGRHDAVVSFLTTTNRSEVGVVTSAGRLLRLAAMEVPLVGGKSRGGPAGEYLPLEAGERAVALLELIDPRSAAAKASPGVALATAIGVVKRIGPDAYPTKSGQELIGLRPGDAVVGCVALAGEDDEVVLVSTEAQLLRTSASTIRPQGRTAGGVAGMRLGEGARVIAVGALSPGDGESVVVTASDAGGVKVSTLAEYPSKGRGGGGVRCQSFRKGEAALVAAWVGRGAALGLSAAGESVELPAERARRDASGVVVDPAPLTLAARR